MVQFLRLVTKKTKVKKTMIVKIYKICCSIRLLSFIFIISLCIFLNTKLNSVFFRIVYKEKSVSKNVYSVQARPVNIFHNSVKHILLWTNPKDVPFTYFEEGNKIFIKKKCKRTNCFVTGNKDYLDSYTEFDVIAFNGPQIPFTHTWPTKRSIGQKYVYANIESASNYPIPNDQFNGVFNWTWTYKLNSDAVWGYFVVRDANKRVIGPGPNVPWIHSDKMDPIDMNLKKILQKKKRTAVWFSSHCQTIGGREDFVRALQKHLRSYNMNVDIYGACGPRHCPPNINSHCLKMVRSHYHFYLAFENAISEDYVTEKVVYALKYDAVPIVYGGANYSRFLPDGSYLDARKLGPMVLAKTMYDLISSPEDYYKFFRWHKYYSFHFKNESPDTDDYCKFCEILNNPRVTDIYSSYDDIRSWWMQGVVIDQQSIQ